MSDSTREFIPEEKLPKPIKSITFRIAKNYLDMDMLCGNVEFVDGTYNYHCIHMIHYDKKQADGSVKDTPMTYEECQLKFFQSLTSPWAYETFDGMSRERYNHINAPDEVKA